MVFFFLKKIGFLIGSFWVVITITFYCTHQIPGDPFGQDLGLSQEALCQLKAQYHLDQPLLFQYWSYCKNILMGNLGQSIVHQGQSTFQIVASSCWISALLGISAMALALIISLTASSWAAWHNKNPWLATLITSGAIAIPTFVLAPLLQAIFGARLQWLPIASWGSYRHAILPIITLAVTPCAIITRLARASLQKTLAQDYIFFARARGLSSWLIASRYLLRNSLPPIIAYLTPVCTALITGSCIVEHTFGIPGMGQRFMASILARDYPVIMGMTIVYTLFLMLIALTSDLCIHLLSPQLTKGERA